MSLDIPYTNTVTGGGVFLAPNLTFPGDTASSGAANYVTAALTTTASLTTALSLTGKFIVNYLALNGMISESTGLKLTVDSVVIWNDTYTSSTSGALLTLDQEGIKCETSFLLEISKATDTAVTLDYLARPIL